MLSRDTKYQNNISLTKRRQFNRKGGERENTDTRKGGEAGGRELVMGSGFYSALVG
jgi:hypothetical protein